MQAQWHALHLRFLSQLHRKSSELHYAALRGRNAALAAATSIDELIFRQRAPDGNPDDRNAVLEALVREAQSDRDCAETASIISIVLLWPGLDAAHARLCRAFPGHRTEIGIDMLGRVALGILKLDLDKVKRIAATLVMNVERDLRRDEIAHQKRGRVEQVWEDEPTRPIETLIDLQQDRVSVAEWRARLLPVIGCDTDLLLRILILGETQAQAGKALGLSHDTARKRHQRALAKLLANSSAALSHPGRAFGL